ncbi:MAG: phage tail protein [Deltaproteobacteria bacterium]|nr:phage tail protein [Deltaproteobacteria bacterium]
MGLRNMASQLNTNQMAADKEGTAYQFEVVISGYRKMTFKSCEGIESEVDVQTYLDGGRMNAPKTARGPQRVGKITFGKGTVGAEGPNGGKSNIFSWYMKVCDSSQVLKKETIVISLLDGERKKLSEWKLINAWPCRWIGPFLTTDDQDLTIDYVSFAHEGLFMSK